PEDNYMKKIWKRLSKEKTMDDMRRALQNDESFKEFQEEIKRELQAIIERNGDASTYEKIYSELAEIDNSDAPDDLESLIRQAVDLKIKSFPQDKKEEIFKKFDKIVDRDYRKQN
ncbi:hypothetical protein L9F63_013479, partial [Diploptera punctata]